MTLNEWGLFYKTDKATAHEYLDFYESRIGNPEKIMEFGILNGASLRMWKYRYNADVTGVDIKQVLPIPGINIWQLDYTDSLSTQFLNGEYDLIIDDASHIIEHMIKGFELYYPMVKKGGCYIIEDCHTMHYEGYNPNKIDFKSWVKSLNLRHEYFNRIPGDESDSMTLIIYKD